MIEKLEELPSEILGCIDPDSLVELGVARLGNQLIRAKTPEGKEVVLKIGSGLSARDIDEEAKRLKWINGRYRAPHLLAHAFDAQFSYSVISWLGDHAAHECIGELSNAVIIEEFAHTLKEIHAADIETCPFISLLEAELRESDHRLSAGLIAEEDFFKDTGEAPTKVFDYLVKTQHIIEEKLLTHGDYCLPNVIFDRNQVCGVVDWGLAGVSDPHRDFMCVELTLRRNMDESNIRYFYQVYGVNEVDAERVRYYWLLDRFFSHSQIEK